MFEDMKHEDQLEMRQLRKMLYRAVKELDYIQTMTDELIATRHEHLFKSSEGEEIVRDSMTLLGCADLAADELPYRLETA